MYDQPRCASALIPMVRQRIPKGPVGLSFHQQDPQQFSELVVAAPDGHLFRLGPARVGKQPVPKVHQGLVPPTYRRHRKLGKQIPVNLPQQRRSRDPNAPPQIVRAAWRDLPAPSSGSTARSWQEGRQSRCRLQPSTRCRSANEASDRARRGTRTPSRQ